MITLRVFRNLDRRCCMPPCIMGWQLVWVYVSICYSDSLLFAAVCNMSSVSPGSYFGVYFVLEERLADNIWCFSSLHREWYQYYPNWMATGSRLHAFRSVRVVASLILCRSCTSSYFPDIIQNWFCGHYHLVIQQHSSSVFKFYRIYLWLSDLSLITTRTPNIILLLSPSRIRWSITTCHISRFRCRFTRRVWRQYCKLAYVSTLAVWHLKAHDVRRPSIESLKKAMQTYARQGGTSTIFICDDGLRVQCFSFELVHIYLTRSFKNFKGYAD